MLLCLLLLAACESPDEDGDLSPSTTPSSPLSADTASGGDTAAVTGDSDTGGATDDSGGDTDTGTPVPSDMCEGPGPADLTLGSGPLRSFVPFVDGQEVPLVVGPQGELGIQVSLLTEGMDTRDQMNAVVRTWVADQDITFVAQLILQCPEPGPGWVEVHAALPDPVRGLAASGQLDGEEIEITLSLTDVELDGDSVTHTLVMTGP